MSDTPVPLVLLPGMDGTDLLCGPLQQALPPWLPPQVVTYPVDGPNGYDDLLPRVVEAVERHPACHVLGWSFSGPLALRVANRCPGRVRSVVLAATFVRPPQPWLPAARPLLCTPLVGAVRFLRRLPLWLGTPPADPFRRAKALVWQTVPARALAARARAIARVDVRADLQQCAAPVLYLAAAADRIVPAANAAEVQRLQPAARLATTPGGHFALFTHAPDGAAAIAAFVGEVDGR